MSALHLFIDTSTFLTFYAFTSDDLEELKKVASLIKNNKLKLYIPEQVADEFYRNREGKLAESLKAFTDGGVSKAVPRFMMEYDEAEVFTQAAKAFQQARNKLAEKARHDAAQKLLPADNAFAEIIEAAGLLPANDAILRQANQRRLRGNPPGKKDSIGDQINWEVLLENVPEGEELHIVAKDGDYESPLSDGHPHQFLEAEWRRLKGRDLHLHTQLRPFLNANFADIKLAVDVEKHSAIDRLIYSGSFATTHNAISELIPFIDELKWDEVERIFDAGLSNNQIDWIGTDADVNAFYRTLMAKWEQKLTPESEKALNLTFPLPGIVEEPGGAEEDDDDFPF